MLPCAILWEASNIFKKCDNDTFTSWVTWLFILLSQILDHTIKWLIEIIGLKDPTIWNIATLVASVNVNSFGLGSNVNKFYGKNFKRWECPILYWLQHLEVKYIFTDEPPVYPAIARATKVEIEAAAQVKQKWDRDDQTWYYHLMESLTDELFE